MRTPQENTIRGRLRGSTRAVHDALDNSISRLDLTDPKDYARFLAIQLAAREPIEAWCASYCTPALRPPVQSRLIRSDIARLGRCVPPPPARAPQLSHNLNPLAVAWVVAGSSLGNRSLLNRMRKAGACDLPTAFLADPAMTEFWHGLKPELDRPVEPKTAENLAQSARAIFAVFARETAHLNEALAA